MCALGLDEVVVPMGTLWMGMVVVMPALALGLW